LLAAAALVDTCEHKLPNRLMSGALFVALVGAALPRHGPVLAAAVVGAVSAGGLMLLVRLARGVGMGDVKMAAVVGASVAGAAGAMAATGSGRPTELWSAALLAPPLAIALAAFAAAAWGLLTRRQRLPLGPALWLGWLLTLSAGAFGWLA
jgi:leader peptidase (prepilin peptidase)/N-methyltransferase